MRAAFAVALAIASLGIAACDNGGTTETASTAAPAASPPPPPPPPPPAPSGMPGLTEPYATEAEWVEGCKGPGLDQAICDCGVKATVKTLGPQALYAWVWEAYIQRNAIAQARSKTWFTANGVDEAKQKAFTDEIGKCYVTQ